MRDAVVIGAGVTRMSAALALARSGRSVTPIERDHGRLPDTVEHAFESWDRHGVPQAGTRTPSSHRATCCATGRPMSWTHSSTPGYRDALDRADASRDH